MDERRRTEGGGGTYDLAAHPNEYIKAYSGALPVPPEPGHYGGGGGHVFVLPPLRRAPLKAICPVAEPHPAAEP